MSAVVAIEHSALRPANADGIGQHRLEHRLKLAGRRADDAQHIRCRRLLLQRFAQFVEQPGVLDGDDSLRCEILQQRDLLIAERANLLPINGNRANEFIVLDHWYADGRPRSA